MNVLFVCAGGMSSAIIVKTLQKEAAKNGLEMKVLAVGTSEFDAEVQNGWDIAMVAPQVRHRFDSFKESAERAGVPIAQIPPQAYSPLGGPALLKTIQQTV